MPNKYPVLRLLFSIIALLYIGLAIAGGINHFSPVPLWDMWNGYLGFFQKINQGGYWAWWEQHNEHRILLARILFYLDLKLFAGSNHFLIIVNYLLIATSALVFYYFSRIQSLKISPLYWLFSLAFLFSWVQAENIVWAFQSQFILAQLLPLMAFYALARYAFYNQLNLQQSSSLKFFILAAVLGVLSLATMANGVIVLPLLTILAYLLRLAKRQIVILLTLSLLAMLGYFYQYQAVNMHGSITQSILHQPGEMLHYILLYLGSPFSLAFAGNKVVASLAGGFFVLSAIFFTLTCKRDPYRLALLFFIIYISGTAFATAGGRVIFGIVQALSSRYTTPAIMAWVALLFLYSGLVANKAVQLQRLVNILLFALLFFMLPQQRTAINDVKEDKYNKMLAALALELGVADNQLIKKLFPVPEYIVTYVHFAQNNQLSVFGQPPLIAAVKQIGKNLSNVLPASNITHCRGFVDQISPVKELAHSANQAQWQHVRGWLYASGDSSQLIYLLDAQNIIRGVALRGEQRLDVAKAVAQEAEYAGFNGYLSSDSSVPALPTNYRAVSPSIACISN